MKKHNIANKDNQGKSGEKKIYKDKSDYMSNVDKFEKGVSLGDKVKIRSNAFSFHVKMFVFIFYIIPATMALLSYPIFGMPEQIISLFENMDYINVDIESLQKWFLNVFSGYLNIFNFGWILNILNIDIYDQLDFIANYLRLSDDFAGKEESNNFIYILFLTMGYLFFTFLSFLTFTFIFRNFNFLSSDSLFAKKTKKINSAYEDIQNLSKSKNKNHSVFLKKQKFLNEKIKKLKKSALKLMKEGKYTNKEAIILLNITFLFKDSAFANQISDIANKNIKDSLKELSQINNNQELHSLLFSKFNEEQKSLIFSYNFHIFNNKKELSGDFKSDWDTLLGKKKIKKEEYIKMLSVIYFFKNYPLSLCIKFLEKEGIVLKKEESSFIEEFRKITFFLLKGERNSHLDLNYILAMPDIKNKDKLSLMFTNFILINQEKTLILREYANISINSSNEEERRLEILRGEKLFQKKVNFYMLQLKKTLKELIIIIFNEKKIEIKDNFDLLLDSALIEYYSIKSNMNLAENEILINKLYSFRISDFYSIINMVRKKSGKYNFLIEPYYITMYKKLNLFKTFKYIKDN